jgi:sugar lactone lactonase YvrE
MNAWRRNVRSAIVGIAAACDFCAQTFAHPGSGINVDRLGQIYFLDTGSGLWTMDSSGALTHISPLRNHWFALDANNAFTQARLPTDPGRDWVLTAAGTNPTLIISTDFSLVIGQDGNLYYPSVREPNVRILRRTPEGNTTAIATLPRSVAGKPVEWINGLTTGPSGSFYYTENNAVRKISARGEVSTVGTVTPLTDRPPIPGSDSRPYLRGLKVDANGVVYVADAADARVLKITPDGKVSTILQLESPWAPTDVALFGDNIYTIEFTHDAGDDRTTWMPRVRKITPDGRSTIIVTVDQMPGARPARTTTTAKVSSPYSYSVGLLELLLRSFLLHS